MLRAKKSIIVAFIILSGRITFGQTVFVEHLYMPTMPIAPIFPSPNYVDIQGSEKSVTIPAGTVVFNWDLEGPDGDSFQNRIRPVIGDQWPTPALRFDGPDSSGSWVTTTLGGTVIVKLQMVNFDVGPSTGVQAQTLTWTLIVIRDGDFSGLNCWDINANGIGDIETEDVNGDGFVNVLDCIGLQGPRGPEGATGPQGPAGTNGLHCWDLNENGVPDFPEEDSNHDGLMNVYDCRALPGNAPAVSTWGLMVLGLLIVTAGTIAVSRRKQAA